MKILVVEDEHMLRVAITHKLEADGYDIQSAVDGKEGLEKIKAEKFDLILSNVMMPFINGLELVANVRDELKLNTPIILLSGTAQENIIKEAFDFGANDFITIPFKLNDLSFRVKKILTNQV
jgi:DNA-binding response OmpR family regulator